MADLPSGEHPNSNGALEGPRKRRLGRAKALEDERALAAREQSFADTEQTLADADQTRADGDQTSSDSDQTSSESDQLAADRDQAASDRDLAGGVDPRAHELSRDLRRRSAQERELTAAGRLRTAEQRDTGAHARDLAALARDHAAAARDLTMTQRDEIHSRALARALTGADVLRQAAAQRQRAGTQRAEAAEHRVLAAEDRQAALVDREQAARDRLQALADRQALARQLTIAETDALTGVRTRAAGLVELDHEVDRCRRGEGSLVVAYVDVVGLKALNDSEGHGAGDALLKRVVAQMRSRLRSYDLIMRLGGDEFLCAMSNITMADARERFRSVAEGLTASPQPGSIRSGLAELVPDETAGMLIARADSELVAHHP
ncbi:MAG: hypothetical protein QOG42_475 [Solirubrobacteraceae bacterium]|nr:hypothetical protein [Solirubrobacteraceae bacterium]